MNFSIKDFKINIPEELIAQYPPGERGRSRLLAFDLSKDTLTDDRFESITNYINSNDCIIFNDTKVINARLHGIKRKTGARIEILLIKPTGDLEWNCLLRPARRIGSGTLIDIDRDLSLEVKDNIGEGMYKISFSKPVGYKELENIGEIPLPKYIKRKPVRDIDSVMYQTIFADKYGAVASPTAGLHFNEKTVEKIKKKGAVLVPVTLYVDWGTFKPVREDDYREHRIHKEIYEISEQSASDINRCINEKRRILCVGTTSVRTVEAASDNDRKIKNGRGETDLYIYPGYTFKVVDGMITNFHMPDSTLILLVAAFCGKEKIERAYSHAVARKYSFFSYGDAMFIFNK
jgi:S-adenosylmethionine:tRNA ribosyltransferase-isomerase